MKVLFISSFYPPFASGGWDQLTDEIRARLEQRGHRTRVATGLPGLPHQKEPDIDRVFSHEARMDHYDPFALTNYRSRLRQNIRACHSAVSGFQPDIVFVHNMWNLTRAVPWVAEQLCPNRVVYYMADHWPWSLDPHAGYWKDPATSPLRNSAKRALAPFVMSWLGQLSRRFRLDFGRVLCVSRAIRDEMEIRAGILADRLHVVHNGIDLEAFSRPAEAAGLRAGKLRVLVAGSLVEHKGVDTAIEAMHVLRQSGRLQDTELRIAGSGHPGYERKLRGMTREFGLEGVIHFLGQVERTAMPELLRQADVFVLPSKWDEPLARSIQEAMAMGLVVIGTATGGTPELLVDNETGFLFQPGAASELADRIAGIRRNPALCQAVVSRGRKQVIEKFDIRRTVENIEGHLVDQLRLAEVGA